jgi:hypothetical protein
MDFPAGRNLYGLFYGHTLTIPHRAAVGKEGHPPLWVGPVCSQQGRHIDIGIQTLYIVSGDIHLLELEKYKTIKIVTAKEYLGLF